MKKTLNITASSSCFSNLSFIILEILFEQFVVIPKFTDKRILRADILVTFSGRSTYIWDFVVKNKNNIWSFSKSFSVAPSGRFIYSEIKIKFDRFSFALSNDLLLWKTIIAAKCQKGVEVVWSWSTLIRFTTHLFTTINSVTAEWHHSPFIARYTTIPYIHRKPTKTS